MKPKYNVLPITEGRIEIDNSGYSEFMTCGFRGYIKQILRRIPTEEDEHAINFGSGVHIGEEYLFKGAGLPKAIEKVLEYFEKNPQKNPLDHRTPDKAIELLKLSVEKYKDVEVTPAKLIDIDGNEILGVELPFRKHMGDVILQKDIQGWDRVYEAGSSIAIFWTGMIDVVYRDKFGRLGIMDHKSTGSFYNFFQRYQESGQFKGYLWAINGILEQMPKWDGRFVDQFTINGFLCPKSGKIDEKCLDRHTFRSNMEKVEMWRRGVFGDIKGIIRQAENGEWSRSGFKNCGWVFGRKCQYFDVCSGSEASYASQILGPAFKNYTWNCLDKD